MSFTCTFIVLQIKLISIWKVVHQDSFWNRGKRHLVNSLFAQRASAQEATTLVTFIETISTMFTPSPSQYCSRPIDVMAQKQLNIEWGSEVFQRFVTRVAAVSSTSSTGTNLQYFDVRVWQVCTFKTENVQNTRNMWKLTYRFLKGRGRGETGRDSLLSLSIFLTRACSLVVSAKNDVKRREMALIR